MSQSRIGYTDQNARSNWMRLRTLVTVRWVAITGQILALALGQELYGLSLALGPCSAVIGLSIIANIFAVLIFPDNRRLSELETVLTLLFDTLQLSLLLAFTGGLNNPFALLILAPVTIAATVLPTRSTLLLAFCSVVMTTTVAWVHLHTIVRRHNAQLTARAPPALTILISTSCMVCPNSHSKTH